MDAVAAEVLLADGGTIITATHRLARQIRWRHDRSQAASGARAWPTADVLALDAWLRRTWEASACRAADLGRRRLLSDDESRLLWRGVLASDGHEGPDTGVMVPLVANAWRLCQAWEISPADLRRAVDSDDARAFAGWVESYVALLAQRGWQDSGGLLAGLGQSATGTLAAGNAPVGLAGFDPLTPALARLVAALREAGVAVFIVEPPVRHGSRGVVAAADENDELARACAWAASRAGGNTDANVAIVVPGLGQDASRIRRVGLDVLAPGWQLREPAVRPLALAAGRQLADYPVIHCALDLLELIATDVGFEQASQLLRSPYLAGASTERAGRARSELRLRRRFVERIQLTALVQVLGRDTGQLAGGWRHAEALAQPVRGRRLAPSQWAGHFSAWLAMAGWPGDRGLSSEEYQAAEAWQKLLEHFAAMDEVAGLMPVSRALGLLGQQARDRSFEPESARGSVQVLSVREAEGQDFDALWICGMTADQWPPPARAHPLVPLALQRAAGVPEATPAGTEAQSRRRLERLLASASEVVLSWPVERELTETLPSPLLGPFDTASVGEASRCPDRLRVAASGEPEEALSDPPPALPPDAAVPGGSRVLALQAVCPARAFVEFRLRGAELEAPARPLDPASRGRVVHRLLERLYRDERCQAGLGAIEPDALRELFDTTLRTVLDELLPGGDAFVDSLRPLESDRLWKLLLGLQRLDAERPGFRVVTEVERQVTIGPLALKVRLDRLDSLADGGALVIDYKTGDFKLSGWKQARLQESQLPLYAVTSEAPGNLPSRGVAVIQLRVPEPKLRGVGADGLQIDGVALPARFFRAEGLNWPDVLARWRDELEQLAGEFARGDFRVDPADRRWAVGQFAGLTRIYEFAPASDDDTDQGDAPDGGEE